MAQETKKVALVTGASSGIGASAAASLKSVGFRVIGTRRQSTGARSAQGIEMLQLDVTNDVSVADAIKQVMLTTGRIDVLVNNAGGGLAGGAEESSIQQALDLFNANLFGAMRMTKGVLPIMRAQGSGRIINISSILGLIPAPYQAIYSSTKHALEGYSESLDHEVRKLGIRVMLVEPAYTKTRFTDNVSGPDKPLDVYSLARNAFIQSIPDLYAEADDPGVVGEVVALAATTSKPKLRYPAGKLSAKLSLLRRLVPASMFDASLRKGMKLD